MTTISFDGLGMIRTLKNFGRASSTFLRIGSRGVDDLARRLEQSLLAKEPTFRWGTKVSGEHVPIETVSSTHWKGAGSHKPIEARFTFGWECDRPDLDQSTLLVRDGATTIDFVDRGNGGLETFTRFHFDLCSGGNKDGSGHPVFHTQFVGGVPDIPRLPSFLIHPVDAMEWALMDCFQIKWRMHLQDSNTRSKLGSHASAQLHRLKATLDHWKTSLDLQPGSPLLALQHQMHETMSLEKPS